MFVAARTPGALMELASVKADTKATPTTNADSDQQVGLKQIKLGTYHLTFSLFRHALLSHFGLQLSLTGQNKFKLIHDATRENSTDVNPVFKN